MNISTLAAQARQAAVDRLAEEEVANQQGGGLLTPEMARERVATDLNRAVDDFSIRMIEGLTILRAQYDKLKGAPGHEEAIPFLEPDFFSGREASFASVSAARPYQTTRPPAASTSRVTRRRTVVLPVPGSPVRTMKPASVLQAAKSSAAALACAGLG